MEKQSGIAQFAPDSKHSDAPGAYGWGFDLNGFRVVMYAPPECDTPIVRELSRRVAARQPSPRKQEHGPAHIHVIHKASGRESKFELIKHYNGDHHVVFLDQNGEDKKPLTPAQIGQATPILSEHAEAFIQLWREFYQDTKLSSYVTRISEKFPGCHERIYYDKGRDRAGNRDIKMVRLEDMRGGSETVMTFDDYAAYAKGDNIPKSPRRR